MTTDAAPQQQPFYSSLVSNLEAALEAGSLIGLQEELRTLRAFVRKYAEEHGDDVESILKAMRLIMQMVVAQHRMGSNRFEEASRALEAATRDYIRMFEAPEADDV